MKNDKRIDFDLYFYYYYDLYLYYRFSDVQLSASDINPVSNFIPYTDFDVKYNTVAKDHTTYYHFYFDEKNNNNHNYYYLAFYLEDMPYNTQTSFYIKSSYISTFAVVLAIIIVIAVLVGLALISMGIAKMMGRSPLDGLLCFFILCALCCCRNR